ncbi:MAG TPA: peptidase MA family metallohydrolase [Polyangia bacterium]
MRRLFIILLFLTFCLPAVSSARAQATVDVTDPQVSYRYGEQVNFQARIKASAPISDVAVLFRAQGESSTRSGRAALSSDGQVSYRYTFTQGPLRSFARVDFWFRVTLQGGEQVESSPFYFYYNDDRFPWKTLEDKGAGANIRLHWYAGDDAFAQQALDFARAGLQKTGQMLSVSPNHPIDIYIYALAADLQSALEIGGQTLAVGGEASPDLGVALVAISPGQEQGVEMERKIPHELAHLLTYELVGQRYDRLPVWLREGIASMAEPANPDYAQYISLAVEQQSLIPIADLCGDFPPEMSRILLAYAESESFTRFIVGKYGDSGLVSLTNAYADDLDCQQGPVRALQNPLDQVEREWVTSADVGAGNVPAAFGGLLPYLVVLVLMLVVPLGFLAAVWRTPDGRERPGTK